MNKKSFFILPKKISIIFSIEIVDKDFYGTTDGGSDVKSACEKIKMERGHCLAHVLHLFINDVLKKFPQLMDFVNKLKAICKALTWSSEVLRKLKEMEENRRLQDCLLFITGLGKNILLLIIICVVLLNWMVLSILSIILSFYIHFYIFFLYLFTNYY